jgi:leucine dehydrogenase
MTYKSAVAATGFGGGKSVIIGDSRTQKSKALFRAMGRFVNDFRGSYYPAEDVGTTTADIEVVAQETKWVTGLPREKGGSGDPSEYTALGVFRGIAACFEEVFGSADFSRRTIAIQGLGSVGRILAERLAKAGARLLVADILPEKVEAIRAATGAMAVDPTRLHTVPADVFAPCALGAILNDDTIPVLRCAIIAGSANNQLAEPRHGEMLRQRGIVYAPDFVINAGGVINISVEFAPGGYDATLATRKTENIHRAVKEVLRRAKDRAIPTSEAAIAVAKERIRAGRGC